MRFVAAILATLLIAATPEWPAGLDMPGWRPLSQAPDVAAWWREAPQPVNASFARLMVRLERRGAVQGFLSQSVLFEIDCSAGRLRALRRIAYRRHRLEGPATAVAGPATWSVPTGAGLEAQIFRQACAGPN